MAEILDIIERVCRAPGMILPEGTYGEFIALLVGVDMAGDNLPLRGFKEWLILKRNGGNNLVWEALALSYLDITLGRFAETRTSEHRDIIRSLTDLVEEFLNDREERGIEEIMDAHQTWLKSQDWYREEIDG